jgi:hypothetical protein
MSVCHRTSGEATFVHIVVFILFDHRVVRGDDHPKRVDALRQLRYIGHSRPVVPFEDCASEHVSRELDAVDALRVEVNIDEERCSAVNGAEILDGNVDESSGNAVDLGICLGAADRLDNDGLFPVRYQVRVG